MDSDDSTDSTIRLNIGNFDSDCGHLTTRLRRLDFDDSTDWIDFDDSTDSAIRPNIENPNSDCGHSHRDKERGNKIAVAGGGRTCAAMIFFWTVG